MTDARARDGLALRTHRWPAVGTPRAHLLLVHGIAEHAGRYEHVAAQLGAAGIDAAVPAWKRLLAKVLAGAIPRFTIANTFPKGGLSSDPAVESAYLADPLAFHRTTARLGSVLFDEQDRVQAALARIGALPVPTYVVHGADDPIVPEWATRSLDGRANVTRRVYPGLHHETHNEPSKAAVIGDTIGWITRQLSG